MTAVCARHRAMCQQCTVQGNARNEWPSRCCRGTVSSANCITTHSAGADSRTPTTSSQIAAKQHALHNSIHAHCTCMHMGTACTHTDMHLIHALSARAWHVQQRTAVQHARAWSSQLNKCACCVPECVQTVLVLYRVTHPTPATHTHTHLHYGAATRTAPWSS